MHFHKYPYPSNFEFVPVSLERAFKTSRSTCRLKVRSYEGDIYHFQVTSNLWPSNDGQESLNLPRKVTREQLATKLTFDSQGAMHLRDEKGHALLQSLPGRFFGQCGESSIFEFLKAPGELFYGLGEKWTGFEHSSKITKFWNTDVWGDFNPDSYIHGRPAADPVYVSVPYLIIKRGNTYLGLLLDNPRATFISTGFKVSIADQMTVSPGGEEFVEAVTKGTEHSETSPLAPDRFIHLGAESGLPSLYLIYGPSLPELTRKLQMLVGTTPMPPAWALGYHQCRWGYTSAADLHSLDANFQKHGIPVDGLWLDIDYMEGYRVFTFAKKHFPDPSKTLRELSEKGRRVIPIIDPGVKLETGYDIYDRGHKTGSFCLNSQGKEYVGLVWPGETVFPDFSMEKARQWWSREVASFARNGIPGAWLDMNDPSTGLSDNEEMRFEKGARDHATYHNQYALGMAKASREGFLKAHPHQRPFLLCRSGSTGSSRYTAIWTGDNYSNYYHLKNSIAITLNLALSGIPFNGPDAGGFGGDTTPALIRDWFKAGFLFPILRNHSMLDTRPQEPWAFDRKTTAVLRRFIQLRYRLRPYLYQLFADQERTGEAILRPLFYDFQDSPALPLGKIDDQFMVGPSILQAPFLESGQAHRKVVLPGSEPWFDLTTGRWIKSHRTITVKADLNTTPVFIRDRTLLPLARIAPDAHEFHSNRIDFHAFISSDGAFDSSYTFDDGLSFSYLKGRRSEVTIRTTRHGRSVSFEVQVVKDGYGEGLFTFTLPKTISQVTFNGRNAAPVKEQGVPFLLSHAQTWEVSE